MPSPFPGMDPYIEATHIWEDFHQSLASEIRDQLAPYLRPRYYAALIPQVSYEEVMIQARPTPSSSQPLSSPPHWVKPDVSIYQTAGAQPLIAEAVQITPAPYMLVEEEFQQTNLEIHEVETDDLVTAIEILSPVNKRPGQKAFEAYRKKRRALLRSPVHLMEIDLLRAGRRTPRVTGLPPAPYFVFVNRAHEEGRGLGAWPLHFREPIPIVPVPLRAPDPAVPLDLGKAIHAIYERAAYDLRLDYTQPPPAPPLTADDAQWLDEHLRAAHLR